MKEVALTELKACARCGEDHGVMAFVPLDRPVEILKGRPHTHWAPCPKNGQPILLAHFDLVDDYEGPVGVMLPIEEAQP